MLRKTSQGNTCRLGLYDFGLLCDRDGQGIEWTLLSACAGVIVLTDK